MFKAEMVWMPVTEALPPTPKTPYAVYCVWMSHPSHKGNPRVPVGYSGVPVLVQFSRDSNNFLIPFGHEHLEITHWGKVPYPSQELADIAIDFDKYM